MRFSHAARDPEQESAAAVVAVERPRAQWSLPVRPSDRHHHDQRCLRGYRVRPGAQVPSSSSWPAAHHPSLMSCSRYYRGHDCCTDSGYRQRLLAAARAGPKLPAIQLQPRTPPWRGYAGGTASGAETFTGSRALPIKVTPTYELFTSPPSTTTAWQHHQECLITRNFKTSSSLCAPLHSGY